MLRMRFLRSSLAKSSAAKLCAGLCTAAVLAGAAGWALADSSTLYLRIRSVFLRTKPSMNEGESRDLIVSGHAVQSLQRSGDWVKVRVEKKDPHAGDSEKGNAQTLEGWIHATALSEQAPPQEKTHESAWLKDGLRNQENHSKTGKAVAHAQHRHLDLKPVHEMERKYPSAEEVEKFLQTGKLGLYRLDWPSLEEGAAK